MKLTKAYVGAVLDTCGCFYLHNKKYKHFKIRSGEEDVKKVLDKVVKVLNKQGIRFGVYELKGHKLYQIADKESMKNLKRFMSRYCLVRRVK